MTDITRGEFDLLAKMVSDNRSRMENIDSGGTRGVTGVQVQLAEVVKDVVSLQAEVTAKFEAHAKQHDQDRRERVSGRRWLIVTALTGIGVLGGIVGLLVEVLAKLGH